MHVKKRKKTLLCIGKYSLVATFSFQYTVEALLTYNGHWALKRADLLTTASTKPRLNSHTNVFYFTFLFAAIPVSVCEFFICKCLSLNANRDRLWALALERGS